MWVWGQKPSIYGGNINTYYNERESGKKAVYLFRFYYNLSLVIYIYMYIILSPITCSPRTILISIQLFTRENDYTYWNIIKLENAFIAYSSAIWDYLGVIIIFELANKK